MAADTITKNNMLLELNELKAKIEALEREGRIAKEKLANGEVLQRAMFDAMPDPAWIKDAEGRFLMVNNPWLQFMGLQRKDCVGKTAFDIFPRDEAQQLHTEDLKVLTTGKRIRMQEVRKNAEGKDVWFETVKGPLRMEEGEVIGTMGIARDISSHKSALLSLNRLNRALKTLVKCNEALMRAEDEMNLLDDICRIIVENDAYRLAWVGYKENDAAKTVRPVALAGYDEGYTRTLNITWADTERGRGPTGTALREGVPCCMKDIRNDPSFTPWRDEALERGYLSTLALPLISGTEVFGALNVYASDPDIFDKQEVNLLVQLANELAYGIMSLRSAAEHRRVAGALARSENILSEAQAITHLGSWEYDMEKDEEYRSAEFFHILGLPSQETGLAHDSVFDYIHPDDKANVLNRLTEALERGRPYEVEYRIIRPDGVERIIHVQGRILEEKDGKKTKFIGTALDVTERKMLEEKQEQLAMLVENSTDFICIAALTGEVTYINSAGLRMTGLADLDEARRSRLSDFAAKEDNQVFEGILREILRNGCWSGEFRLCNLATGIVFPVELTGFLIASVQTGEPIALATISRDTTERKRHENALRHSEARFRSLVETTSDWIWEIDENSTYTYVSPKIRDLLGYEAEDVVGKTPFDFMHPEDAQRMAEKFNTIKAERKSFSGVENVNISKDGNLVTIETNGVPIFDVEGRFCGYRGIDRDVTARKKLEQQYLHAQKMEAVGQLAGGIAHDFNNILTAMTGFLYLLSERIADEKGKHFVDQVKTLTEKATELTESLLMFSRKREQTFLPEAIDLNIVIKRSGNMLKRLIGENIEFRSQLHEGPLPVTVVPNQIEQVLMNLATNARDAMLDGGILKISTEAIEIDGSFIRKHGYGEPGRYALISVADNGTGMDEKTLAKVFEPFYTTKELGKGTGLGLSTAYGIIKQHSGYITAASELGKGTTFRIYLPLTEAWNRVPIKGPPY